MKDKEVLVAMLFYPILGTRVQKLGLLSKVFGLKSRFFIMRINGVIPDLTILGLSIVVLMSRDYCTTISYTDSQHVEKEY